MTQGPHNRKGFVLLATLLFGAAAGIVFAAAAERVLAVDARIAEAQLRLQASNLAAEGIELFRGWSSTKTNADRQDGWAKSVAPLAGKYVVSYGDGGYEIAPEPSENVPFSGERDVTFVRTLEIRDGKLPGEKDVTCAVAWGGPVDVSYQTTLTDA